MSQRLAIFCFGAPQSSFFYHGFARTYTHTPRCLATNVVVKTSLVLEHPPFTNFVASSVFGNTPRLIFKFLLTFWRRRLIFHPHCSPWVTLWAVVRHSVACCFRLFVFFCFLEPSRVQFFVSWLHNRTLLRPWALPDQQLITKGCRRFFPNLLGPFFGHFFVISRF